MRELAVSHLPQVDFGTEKRKKISPVAAKSYFFHYLKVKDQKQLQTLYSWNLIVLALGCVFVFDFFRFLSALPGAGEDICAGLGVTGVGGDAMEDSGLRLDVLDPSDNGETTLEHSSANVCNVWPFSLGNCCRMGEVTTTAFVGMVTATFTIPALAAAVSRTSRGRVSFVLFGGTAMTPVAMLSRAGREVLPDNVDVPEGGLPPPSELCESSSKEI